MSEKIPQPGAALKEEKFKKIGYNAEEWAKKLREEGDPRSLHMAKVLEQEDKDFGYEKVKELNLPRYERITKELDEFLKNPNKYFDELGTEFFYLGLWGKEKGTVQRHGKTMLNREQVLEYIKLMIPEKDIEKYRIAVEQHYPNDYGGTLQIGKYPWEILAELKRKNQTELAKGIIVPEFTMKREKSGAFRYSFDDEELRKTIQDALMAIPHHDDGAAREFHPGYYEFAIIRRTDDSPMEVKFFDYKESKVFNLNWESEVSVKDAKDVFETDKKKQPNEN